MGKIIYLITTSLDGFAADENGKIDWAMPSEEVHAFVNDIVRKARTILMGRKLYEVMKVWDHIPTEGTNEFMDGPSEGMNDYAGIWQAAKKIVFSRTLSEVETANTTIEREFNAKVMKNLIAGADQDFDIGGPTLAAEAIKANLVDDYHQFIAPVLIGSGTHWLPKGIQLHFKLVEARQFANGFAYLHFRKE